MGCWKCWRTRWALEIACVEVGLLLLENLYYIDTNISVFLTSLPSSHWQMTRRRSPLVSPMLEMGYKVRTL